MFTSSIIAILTISRAIYNQSCMGGSGWFAKGTELSWISTYCLSLIEIQSKLKTVSHSQAIVYGLTDDGHHVISSSGLRVTDACLILSFYSLFMLYKQSSNSEWIFTCYNDRTQLICGNKSKFIFSLDGCHNQSRS